MLIIFSSAATAQSSIDLYGNRALGEGLFRQNSFESNVSNYNHLKEWEISMIMGSNISGENASDIYLLSAAKKLGNLYLIGRYTPGIKKSFILRKNSYIFVNDSTDVSTPLNTELNYSEDFGIGLGYQFLNNFSAGISMRYFTQDFVDEFADPFFSVDTISFITKTRKSYNTGLWRFDVGGVWEVIDNLSIAFNTTNLITIFEEGEMLDEGAFSLYSKKGAALTAGYSISKLTTNITFETQKSFLIGAGYKDEWFSGIVELGFSIGHDPDFGNGISAILPFFTFTKDFYSVNLSAAIFPENKETKINYTDFIATKIKSPIFNPYEANKIFLSTNIALSFTPKKKVQFLEIKSIEQIYPAITEKYNSAPFATALVTNISSEKVNVKPSSYISEINSETVYSPVVEIAAGDTVEVPFYTVIPDDIVVSEKRFIANADFFITTQNSEPDDMLQKPLFVGGKNDWDGEIVNLSYFVKKDISEMAKRVKKILQEEKTENHNRQIEIFNRVKVLFESFSEGMKYVSDPRATTEYVQYPLETIELRGGDCDDLSVAFSAMLESVGIQTAFVDYRNDKVNHVNLLVNTGIPAGNASLITGNDKKFFVRKNLRGEGEVWIPLELTNFDSFEKSWELGSEKFYEEAVSNLGLHKSKVFIVDVR